MCYIWHIFCYICILLYSELYLYTVLYLSSSYIVTCILSYLSYLYSEWFELFVFWVTFVYCVIFVFEGSFHCWFHPLLLALWPSLAVNLFTIYYSCIFDRETEMGHYSAKDLWTYLMLRIKRPLLDCHVTVYHNSLCLLLVHNSYYVVNFHSALEPTSFFSHLTLRFSI